MKKRVLAILMTAALAAASLTGCGAKNPEDNSTKDTEGYTIGISQFAVHGSLDNCREGFLAGLAEEGFEEGKNLTITYVNAQADPGTAALTADNFVSKKVDMICAIATPSAMAAFNSTMNTDIPVIYTAVSDPEEAGLAKHDGLPTGNATGTCDALAVEEQLAMIRQILPEAKKIGIIYTTSEANSISSIEKYQTYAGEYGFEIVTAGVTAISEVALAAADMASKVDCITNLTDNTVVSALQTVLEQANARKIPVFGSEVEQVKAGCVASMGLEYFELGKQTGRIAAKLLRGEIKAGEKPFETIDQPSLYVNTAAAEKIGLTLEQAFVDGADQQFDEITVNQG